MKIDNEFKTLIPPLTAEEYQGLEKSILAEGCRDSLIVWHDTLIDGHNRHEICTKHGIPYKTSSMEFESREKVIEWIILNQFGRRNLPAHERARLALRLKPVIAEKAKAQQLSTLKQGDTVPQISAKREMPIETREELAKVAGVSHDTIAKVEKIESDAPAPIIEASRKGEISVNAAYQATKFAPEEKAEISDAPIPRGQLLALMRIADDLQKSGKPTIICLCRHNVDDCSMDIQAAEIIVSDLYFDKEWHKEGNATLREMCDRFINYVDRR